MEDGENPHSTTKALLSKIVTKMEGVKSPKNGHHSLWMAQNQYDRQSY